MSSTPRYRIAAIILAAGKSQRMGANNKLLAEIDGKPMIRRVIEQVQSSTADSIVVITGHNSGELSKALGDFKGRCVHNPDYGEGMSTSLRCGIEALEQNIDGALVILGDMPKVSSNHINKLIDAFDPENSVEACLPVYENKRGNPVLWGRRYFDDIRAISGDKGARDLILKFENKITLVNMSDDGIFVDVDTPESLEKLKKTNLSKKSMTLS
ncbi:MAG: nucleotidyltransferase family protein [Rhodospirillales bacterium]|nr:nucleotidyltransferase family protein [Rhodospirillales bacterium]